MSLNESYFVITALTVLGTSVYGGAILAGAIDYFVEKLMMVKWVWDRITLRQSSQPCWFSWIILSIWPGMVVFGLITQFAITGRGIHHQQCKNQILHVKTYKAIQYSDISKSLELVKDKI